jgi:hypothetical protein
MRNQLLNKKTIIQPIIQPIMSTCYPVKSITDFVKNYSTILPIALRISTEVSSSLVPDSTARYKAVSEFTHWFGNNNFQSQSFDSAQACSELAESDGEQTCLERSRKSRTILT